MWGNVFQKVKSEKKKSKRHSGKGEDGEIMSGWPTQFIGEPPSPRGAIFPTRKPARQKRD